MIIRIQEQYGIQMLDFQADGVKLIGPNFSFFYPYNKTNLKLTIWLRDAFTTKIITDSFFEHRFHLWLQLSCAEEEKNFNLVVFATLTRLFKILDFSYLFASFSCSFNAEDEKAVSDYKKFIEQQIQNYYQYGAFFPYPKEQFSNIFFRSIIITLCLLFLVIFVDFKLMRGYSFLMLSLIILPFILWPVYRQLRAYLKIRSFKSN